MFILGKITGRLRLQSFLSNAKGLLKGSELPLSRADTALKSGKITLKGGKPDFLRTKAKLKSSVFPLKEIEIPRKNCNVKF